MKKGRLVGFELNVRESSKWVRTPTVDKDDVAVVGSDGLGVSDRLPRELWETLALNVVTCQLGFEPVFLAVGGIPNPVHEQVEDEQRGQGGPVPTIDGRSWLAK